MALSYSNRRLLILAGTAFFIASAYLCATRLFAMDFIRESHEAAKEPAKEEAEEPPEIKLTAADAPMSYGEFNRPLYNDVTLTAALPEEYVPTLENSRRLVVVGDIHGMDTSLAELLDEVSFDPLRDHLVATGDMVSKGPDSPAVLSRLMELNASAVRGNNDDRVLLASAELDSQRGLSAELATPGEEEARGESQDLKVARSLSAEQLKWLQSLPVILTAEPLQLYVVHAGLVPAVRLSSQDPWAVMNMRTLVYPKEDLRKKEHKRRSRRDVVPDIPDAADLEGAADETKEDEKDHEVLLVDTYPDDNGTVPTEDESPEDKDIEDEDEDVDTEAVDPDRAVAVPVEGRDGEYWYEAWNKYQKRLRHKERHTVVYGHDAKTGVQEGDYTFGLDSSCVTGGKLTALILEAAEEEPGFKTTMTQVACKKP